MKRLILVAIIVAIWLVVSFSISVAISKTREIEATYYNHGAITASGEGFDPNGLTAASPTIPFGTWVRVNRIDSGGKEVVFVRINDRCKSGIDLTPKAFSMLAPLRIGKIKVRVNPQ